MVQIVKGELLREDMTRKAMGGTELIASKMVETIDPNILKEFQIVHSRVRGLEPNLKRVFVAHDLPGDPESEFLHNGGYNHFDSLVFVSNWQMQAYINHYSIPWRKCKVIQNAVVGNIKQRVRNRVQETARIVYHTTPHRGLDILANAFSNISINDPRVTLDVYSSFKIYGWEERDDQFKKLFEFLKSHPRVTYHGSVSHEELLNALPTYDIFAYPSTWQETSCISLMEAMTAGLLCIHPNLAALPETAANWTQMYQYIENKRDHTREFEKQLNIGIESTLSGRRGSIDMIDLQVEYASMFYSWPIRVKQWTNHLEELLK